MRTSYYNIKTGLTNSYLLALIADFHDSYPDDIVNSIEKVHPDYILINGDLLYSAQHGRSIYDECIGSGQHIKQASNTLRLLNALVKIAPVFFSTGNHELYLNTEDKNLLRNIGITLLNDSFVMRGDLCFGGLSSPYWALAGTGVVNSTEDHKARWKTVFDNVHTEWLDEFGLQRGFKILLNHHPEFYEAFLKNRKGIDLILAGHAHGGQIRLFGRGLYAYGQGVLPKYTKGIYDGKLIVSAGLANTARIPRLFNPTELVYVALASAT